MSVLTIGNDEFEKFPPLLQEYASYMVAVRGNSEKTICEYLLDMRTFFRYYMMRTHKINVEDDRIENIDISELTKEEILSVKERNIIEFLVYSVSVRKNDASTRLRKLSALRSLYHYLHHRRHYMDYDPTADVEGPKMRHALPKYMTYDECIHFLNTVRSDTHSSTVVRDYAMIALLLNTGMRVSELVGLNLKSFDPDLTYVKVLGKGNKERIIYLNDASRDSVKSYLRIRLDPSHIKTDDPSFFLSGREQRISVKTVQWVVYKYLDMAGLGNRGLSVHKLRHTAATLMYQSGKVDVRVLKDVLGHEQLNTTQIYTHIIDRNLKEAVEQNPLAHTHMKKSKKEENDDDNRR